MYILTTYYAWTGEGAACETAECEQEQRHLKQPTHPTAWVTDQVLILENGRIDEKIYRQIIDW